MCVQKDVMTRNEEEVTQNKYINKTTKELSSIYCFFDKVTILKH